MTAENFSTAFAAVWLLVEKCTRKYERACFFCLLAFVFSGMLFFSGKCADLPQIENIFRTRTTLTIFAPLPYHPLRRQCDSFLALKWVKWGCLASLLLFSRPKWLMLISELKGFLRHRRVGHGIFRWGELLKFLWQVSSANWKNFNLQIVSSSCLIMPFYFEKVVKFMAYVCTSSFNFTPICLIFSS